MLLVSSLLFSLIIISLTVYDSYHIPVLEDSIYFDNYISLNESNSIVDNKLVHITSKYYKPPREINISGNTNIHIRGYFDYLWYCFLVFAGRIFFLFDQYNH